MSSHTQPSRVGRRTVLKGAGAVLSLAALGGAWRAASRGVIDPARGPAFDPWADWQAHERGDPAALVSAAILASNAHNAQPWLFRMEDTRIDLLEDGTRHLGTLDPFGREMHIGLGGALENLLLAAGANGYEHRLSLSPRTEDPVHVASVTLFPGPSVASSLYAAIPQRHTNRHPFDTSQTLPRSAFTSLERLNDEQAVQIVWFTSKTERDSMHELLAGAAEAINADTEQSYDNGLRWLRQDRNSIEEHRDGLTLDTMGLEAPTVVAAKMLPDPSAEESGRAWIASIHEQANTAGAFGILAVRNDRDRAERLRTGRIWQRMHLWIAANELAAQPMNQLHERADREDQLGLEPQYGDALDELIHDPGWHALFTFRVGHPTQPAPSSPRRHVSQVITTS